MCVLGNHEVNVLFPNASLHTTFFTVQNFTKIFDEHSIVYVLDEFPKTGQTQD